MSDISILYRTPEVANFMFAAGIETRRAQELFPMPNPTLAALTEEVGELAKALLHIREGKSDDWSIVEGDAVQVAAMACRIALEGDPTLGEICTPEGSK